MWWSGSKSRIIPGDGFKPFEELTDSGKRRIVDTLYRSWKISAEKLRGRRNSCTPTRTGYTEEVVEREYEYEGQETVIVLFFRKVSRQSTQLMINAIAKSKNGKIINKSVDSHAINFSFHIIFSLF